MLFTDLKHHDGRHDDGTPEVYFPFRSCAEPEKLIAIRRPISFPEVAILLVSDGDRDLWPESAIHGLPVTLRMLRVKSDKSDWF